MGKQVSGIKFTGKYAGMVGYRGRKGNVLVRDLVVPANPSTLGQRKVRTTFLALTAFVNAVPFEGLAGVRPLAKSNGISARNQLFKLNKRAIQQTVTGNEVQTVVKLTNIKIAKGSAPVIPYPQSINSADLQSHECGVHYDLTGAYESGALSSLEVVAMIVIPDLRGGYSFQQKSVIPASLAGDIKFSFDPDAGMEGQTVQCYIYVKRMGENQAAYYELIANGAKGEVAVMEASFDYSDSKALGLIVKE